MATSKPILHQQKPGLVKTMFFNRLFHEAPASGTISGIANYVNGNAHLEVTVTDGSNTANITGGDTLADFGTLAWSGVLEDTSAGTNERKFYPVFVQSIAGTVATIVPPAPFTGAAKLHNRHEAALGQHYTEAGMNMLADIMYFAPATYYAFGESLGEVSGEWEWLSPGFLAGVNPSYWQWYGGAATNSHDWKKNLNISQEGRVVSDSVNATEVLTDAIGEGLFLDFPTDGSSGIFSVSVAHRHADATKACQIEVLADGVTIFTAPVYGTLRRFYVAFGSCQTLTCRITDQEGTAKYIRIGKVIVSTTPPQRPFLLPGDRLLMVGDSWFAPTGYIGYRERLGELHDTPIITEGVGGETADYMLDIVSGKTRLQGWIDEHRPTVVVIHFYINDQNAAKSGEQWAAEISEACQICIDNGVQPVVITPGCTGSASQTQALQVAYGGKLGEPGRHRETVFQEWPLAIQSSAGFVNNVGKFPGRVIRDMQTSELYVASGSAVTDAWMCITATDADHTVT